ncbi:MAG TPA: DUF6531 domain-containing protein, partial [Blastocatellia bacterium]|nr:DUF6531 domain-containing protein [Blastocatellia bacterium]
VNPINQAPVVSAGANQTVSLPHAAVLNGTVTDDGQPAGISLSIQWSVVSGPGSVVFANPNQASTTASFTVPGHYVLQLYASDTDLFSSSTVNITVTPPNQPPVVSAGTNQTITLPTNSVTLTGTASDDGLPVGSTLTTTWSQISGPSSVVFGTPNSLTTTASFNNTPGTYVLRLTASDGELSSTSDVTITVTAQNQPPVVNAGADQTITLPNNQVFLSGSATDDGLPTGSTLTENWTLVSGPAAVIFGNAHNAATTATFSVDGVYVLQLSASDGQLSSSATTTVTVNPATAAPTVSIDSPADAADITKRTDVVGTVSFPSAPGTWKLEYSLNTADGSPSQTWTTFATGSGSMLGATLGTFDPTVLLNGTYTIRLTATDQGGQTSSTTVSVIVSRNQKVGNFTVSFNDISVPLPGLPIQVVRTYDSRDKSQGDFGIGWAMSLSNIRIEKTGTLGDHWKEDSTGGLLPTYSLQSTKPRIVTIIFPDDKVYKFQVTTSPSSQRLGPITGGTIGFTQMPGATGTAGARLEVVGSTDFLVSGSVPGLVQLVDINSQNLFNPTRFKLTVAEGYSYLIDQGFGVQSITDPNGNTLTINPNGITHSNGESIAFTRDAIGRITQITDLAGHSIIYNYDTNGDLHSVTDRVSNTTTFTYDNNHYLLTITDSRGVTSLTNQFDASGRLINQTDALGKTIGYQHDLVNNQEKITDRLGNVTTNFYDDDGNIIKTIDAKGGITTYTYDSDDNQLTVTNALGNTTTDTYDSQGNKLTETDPLNHTTTFTYNNRRQVLTVIDPRGGVTTNTYDNNGNLLSIQDALGNIAHATYNQINGLMLTVSNALAGTTTYTYDSQGNLSTQKDPLGNVITFGYDANHNRISQTVTRTTPGGTVETITTNFQYDNQNRQTKTIYPDNSTSQVVYNSIGQKAATIDQLGHQTSFAYDDAGRLTTTTYPDSTTESSTYDVEGRRLTSTDRAGRVTSFTYDELGRLTKTTYADNTFTTTTLDAIGEATSVTDVRGNSSYQVFDAAGRRTSIIDALNGSTSFSYDQNGNQISITDANSHTTGFEYNLVNRQTKVIYNDGTTNVTAYDALGRVRSRTDQAGKITNYGYDDASRLSSITDSLGQVTSYTYDELGHQLTQTDPNNDTTMYEYDQLGRRTKRILPLGMFETYVYDNVGRLQNRT